MRSYSHVEICLGWAAPAQQQPSHQPPNALTALDGVDGRGLEDYGIDPDSPGPMSDGDEMDLALAALLELCFEYLSRKLSR